MHRIWDGAWNQKGIRTDLVLVVVVLVEEVDVLVVLVVDVLVVFVVLYELSISTFRKTEMSCKPGILDL
jgi:hypothetical protein